MGDRRFDYSRASLYRLAWILWAASLVCPSPGGSVNGGSYYPTAFYMLAYVIRPEAMPAFHRGFDPWRVSIFTLGLFSNSAFLFTPFIRFCTRVSSGCAAFLIGAVAVDLGVAVALPEFARTPAYWLWLASIVTLAWTFLALRGPGQPPPRFVGRRTRARGDDRSNAAGAVPAFIWGGLAWTVFWLAVGFSGQPTASTEADTKRSESPRALTAYVTDDAQVLAPADIERFNQMLAQFERDTSNQVAVVIYPRVPHDIVEQFTIRTADLSRLGRRGLDNGAILFVFVEERLARLEVGYGLESVLNDAKMGRILEASLVPGLRRGAYPEAIESTLAAIIENVRDAYRGGKMPSRFAVFRRQLAVEIPRRIRGAWPALVSLSTKARLVIAFFGTLIGLGLWDGLLQLFRILRNIQRQAANLAARRPLSRGIVPVRFESVWDSIKVFAIIAAAIAGLADLVIVAGGGAFGGGGAFVRW